MPARGPARFGWFARLLCPFCFLFCSRVVLVFSGLTRACWRWRQDGIRYSSTKGRREFLLLVILVTCCISIFRILDLRSLTLASYFNFNRYAEMDKVAKNLISHRFKALEILRKWLEAHP